MRGILTTCPSSRSLTCHCELYHSADQTYLPKCPALWSHQQQNKATHSGCDQLCSQRSRAPEFLGAAIPIILSILGMPGTGSTFIH